MGIGFLGAFPRVPAAAATGRISCSPGGERVGNMRSMTFSKVTKWLRNNTMAWG
jgi:hypothetical protein